MSLTVCSIRPLLVPINGYKERDLTRVQRAGASTC